MKKSYLYTAHNNPIIFQKYKKSPQNFRKIVRVLTTVKKHPVNSEVSLAVREELQLLFFNPNTCVGVGASKQLQVLTVKEFFHS